MDIKSVQLALKERGHDPGTPDGIWGRNSIAALKDFQKAAGLTIDGVIGPKTMAALFPKETAVRVPTGNANVPAIDPVWYSEGLRKMGLSETRDRLTLMQWLRSDGKTLGDPSKLPWCGDFAETCIALTLPDEPMVANPYYALNWLKFGQPLASPARGAVLIFKRPGGGHIGFYAGEDSTRYYTLGGNCANKVAVVPILKSRCVGIRWPVTVPLPTSGRIAMSGGKLSTNEA